MLVEQDSNYDESFLSDVWLVSASVSDEVVGFAYAMEGLAPDACITLEIAVMPAYRRMTIGSQIILSMAQWMNNLGYARMWIGALPGSEQAMREGWFERLGFVEPEEDGGHVAILADLISPS